MSKLTAVMRSLRRILSAQKRESLEAISMFPSQERYNLKKGLNPSLETEQKCELWKIERVCIKYAVKFTYRNLSNL